MGGIRTMSGCDAHNNLQLRCNTWERIGFEGGDKSKALEEQRPLERLVLLLYMMHFAVET